MGMAIIRPDIHSLNCHGPRGSVLGKASGWLFNAIFQAHNPAVFQRIISIWRIFWWQPVGESNPSFQVENLAS